MLDHLPALSGPLVAMRLLSLSALLASSLCFAQAPTPPPGAPAFTPPPPSFASVVRPLLQTSCQQCHNAKMKSGEVNFEVLKYATSVGPQAAVWEKAAYVMKMGQMPPQGAPPADPDSVKTAVAFLEDQLAKSKAAAPKADPPTTEWLTWQGDPERTGWARAEKTLSKDNVGNLSLLWKTQLDATVTRINGYATLTDPLVVENVPTKNGPKRVVYTAGGEDTVYALDADSGTVIWQRKFPNPDKPKEAATGNCPNNLNATPTIDKKSGVLYVLTTDGKLRGLGIADGDDRMTPTTFVPAYTRNWSLMLSGNLVYGNTSRGCAGAMSSIVAMDVKDSTHPIYRFFPSTGKGSGPWGRGGIVKTPYGVITQTADGVYDPASGRFGNTFLGLSNDLRLTDSYTPANEDYLNRKDFDLGSSSPTVFQYEKWTLVAAAAKEGVVYLLDAGDLGGADHRKPLYTSPRYGNDALTFGYNGVWGSVSTWLDAKGQRWVLVPMEGPAAKDTVASFKYQNGPTVNGSVMAFKVRTEKGKPVLDPVWISHDLDLPGMPVAANGVVYAVATGDRARDALRGFPGGGRGGPGGAPGAPGAGGPGRAGAPGAAPGGRGGGRGGFGGPTNEVAVGEPGAERDAAWLSAQREPGGQVPGTRFSGGIDLTHLVLSAFDAETGKEIYNSKDSIDTWNHYGGIALSDGRIYMTGYDGRVFAFGIHK